MDVLSNLKYAESSKKQRKRVGRGEGSGHGGQATRGMNGQRSRSGSNKRMWFEGGQMPLQRRIPKFGFTNIFKETYQLVNLNSLQRLADENRLGKDVNIRDLKNLGLISNTEKPVKILGKGDFKAKVNFEVNAISQSAKEKIESAGGSIKLV
jgi:large subunit ribosomal protein L15